MANESPNETVEDGVRRIETAWIPMRDGCRLAARLWIPLDADDRPVPAILEHLPYRRRDYTRLRDDGMHGFWARNGYACARVDIRGSGDSEGFLEDEYLRQELEDAVDVIAWLADREWCSGSVGMTGISWGGFNGLQVAALRPPALKAVVTACSTDDRYADDIHYMGGCLITDNLGWASTMLGFNSRPPDPEVVGEDWRKIWLERLDRMEPWIHRWLRHQRRDGQWKHGSVCEDWGRIQAAVYAVGGWADGYSNAIPRLMASLRSPCKGLIGPWPHAWPHLAVPGPRIDWLGESLRWWDRWLKGEENGIMDEPRYRVWMQESQPPRTRYEERPGRWVAEDRWPSPQIADRTWSLGAGSLVHGDVESEELACLSPQDLGARAGEWCPYGIGADLPGDQRPDDGMSLAFDSGPLPERVEILGAPEVRLEISVDRPVAFLAARLVDVAPDGAASLVTYGLRNLAHSADHANVEPIRPGERFQARVAMNDVAHAFPAGHRIRLALSTSYWPRAWPSPEAVTLRLFTGGSRLSLPVRAPRASDAALRDLGQPRSGPAGSATELRRPDRATAVRQSPRQGRTVIRSFKDRGRIRLEETGMTIEARCDERYEIASDDPLAAEHAVRYVISMQRGDWQVRTASRTVMTSTKSDYLLSTTLDAYEGDVRVRARTWSATVPRDGT